MKQSQYRFIEDPGHGWIEVSMLELKNLGISDKISGYSYMSRDRFWAYLEEDCDLSLWATAKGFPYPVKREEWSKFWEQNIKKEYQENTFVRNLPGYMDVLKAA